MQPRHGPQQGIALVMALLIVAVASITAVAMLSSQNLAVHRSSNLRFAEQAWWYGAGVENWIAQILKQDRKDGAVDHLGEDWAQPVDYLPIEGGFVRGRVIDQEGCINLNNLVGAHAESTSQQLQRLMALLESGDTYNAPGLIQAMQDWIDADQEPRAPGGAEDSIYSTHRPAYRAANQAMLSPSELLLIQGMTPELYEALLPNVCTVPEGTTINVNTASVAVLASLATGMTLADGQALVERRKNDPFDSVQEFRQTQQLAGRQVDEATLSVDSDYFMLQGEVNVGTGRVNLYSLFFRDGGGATHLLAHSKDAY